MPLPQVPARFDGIGRPGDGLKRQFETQWGHFHIQNIWAAHRVYELSTQRWFLRKQGTP